MEFGSEIVPEEEPTKEGYTFSGWNYSAPIQFDLIEYYPSQVQVIEENIQPGRYDVINAGDIFYELRFNMNVINLTNDILYFTCEKEIVSENPVNSNLCILGNYVSTPHEVQLSAKDTIGFTAVFDPTENGIPIENAEATVKYYFYTMANIDNPYVFEIYFKYDPNLKGTNEQTDFYNKNVVFGRNGQKIGYFIGGHKMAKQINHDIDDYSLIPYNSINTVGSTILSTSIDIPEVMPAHDVTISGSFSVNCYDLVYMVDDEEYKRVTLEFGSEIVPEEEPEKEGYTFSGWSDIPETVPAEDITITGSFSINSYDLVYMVDDEEYKRITLEFGSEIVPEEEPTKEGYTFSGWSEIPETMPAHDVKVTGSFIPTNVSEITAEVSLQINGNNISLSNTNNTTVSIYTINGVLVKKIDKYTGEEITLENGVYIVCVGDKAMKIIL